MGLLESILTHNSEDLTMLSLLASLYLENNNLDSAYRVYDKLTQLEPDNANLYFNKAKIFYEWKSYDDALQEIASSLRLEPDNEDALELKDRILQKSSALGGLIILVVSSINGTILIFSLLVP
jgi:tetratricopeptide (TPR) repeat protein